MLFAKYKFGTDSGIVMKTGNTAKYYLYNVKYREFGINSKQIMKIVNAVSIINLTINLTRTKLKMASATYLTV